MLTELFKTKERVRIISYILYQKSFTVNQVSNETGITKGLVSRYLKYLHGVGLFAKTKNIYQPIECAHTRAIRSLLNLNKINIKSLVVDWTTGIGIFGSWAEGTNTYESDLDIWVKVDAYPAEYKMARLQRDISAMAGVEVNMLVLTPEKMKSIKMADQPFYNSLLRTSILLEGGSIE
jgi:predicted nucleotidyltransferase